MGEARYRKQLGLTPEDRPAPKEVREPRAWRALAVTVPVPDPQPGQPKEIHFELHKDGSCYQRVKEQLRRVRDPKIIEIVRNRHLELTIYSRMLPVAKQRGWAIPKEPLANPVPQAAWLRFWDAMAAYEHKIEAEPDAQISKPVAPDAELDKPAPEPAPARKPRQPRKPKVTTAPSEEGAA